MQLVRFSIISFIVIFSVFAQASTSPTLDWSFKTTAPIYGTCLKDSNTLFCANTAGDVYALGSKNGNLKWTFKSGGPIYSGLSGADGTLYFQSDDGFVYKLAAADGALIWKAAVTKNESSYSEQIRNAAFEPGGWDDRSSTPREVDGVVYVGSVDGHVYAFNAKTGDEVWSFLANDKVRSSLAIADGLLVFGTFGGIVHCLNSVSGDEVWQFDVESIFNEPSRRIAINSDPVIDRGTVYIGSRNLQLFALGLSSGKPKWVYPYPKSWVESSATIDGDVLYIGSSFLRSQLAINRLTGELIWQNKSVLGLSFSQPNITDTAYYTGITGGFNVRQQTDFAPFGGLLKLDKVTGKEVWRFELDDFFEGVSERGVIGQVIIDQHNLFFGALDGVIYSLKDI